MKIILLCLACFVFLFGCGSYYKVTDPASKSIYYTEDVDQLKNGAVKFKDVKTGGQVTLQSSEIKEIDSKEFKQGIKPDKAEEKK